jgi:DNA recombination protein RmuC
VEYVIAALVLGVGAVVAALLLRRALESRRPDNSLTLLQNQLAQGMEQTARNVEGLANSIRESLQGLSGQVARSIADSNRNVGERLDAAGQIMGDLRQKLGLLEASSQRMNEIGKDIAGLQDILKPPKLRGALGELFLGDLLAQVLPAEHYGLQHRFKDGDIVDAVVSLRMGLVAIDAKFPLENLRRILDAGNDEERKTARRAFLRDVKGHIDAISAKYIRPDEGTFDFALMYIPAENVYYEVIVRDDEFGGEMSLFNYALSRHVIPVSPNSFYAYLQTIILGLKGMRVEEQSRMVIEQLSRLGREFEAFAEAFRLVGQHLDNSSKKFQEAQHRFERIASRVDRISGVTAGAAESGLPEGSAPARLP